MEIPDTKDVQTYTLAADNINTAYAGLIKIARLRRDDNLVNGREPAIPEALSAADADAYLESPRLQRKLKIELTDVNANTILLKRPDMLKNLYDDLRALDANGDGRIGVEEHQGDLDVVLLNNRPTEIWEFMQPIGTTELEEQIRGVIEKNKSAVFQIATTTNAGITMGSASIIDKSVNANGSFTYRVLTNAHVVEGLNTYEIAHVVTSGDGQFTTVANLIGLDVLKDLAVLEFSAIEDFQKPEFATGLVSENEHLVAIGNPQGEGIDYRPVVVIDPQYGTGGGSWDYAEETYDCRVIKVLTAAQPGNSGGPLYNLSGELVGVFESMQSTDTSIFHAIPIDEIGTSYENMMAHADTLTVSYGDWGLTVHAMGALDRESLLPADMQTSGIRVTQVYPDSPAARAGLMPGDIITAIDGDTEVTNIVDERQMYKFMKLVRESKQGQGFTITAYDPLTKAPKGDAVLYAEGKNFGRVASYQTAHRFLVTDLSPQFRNHNALADDVQGVSVHLDDRDNPPYEHLCEDAIITHINGIPTPNVGIFQAVIEQASRVPDNDIVLRVQYASENYYNSLGGVGSAKDIPIRR